MINTFISLLFVGAGAAATAVHRVVPASSYIYRSDNHGPASLIQLGEPAYQLKHAFPQPLPLRQPVLVTYNTATKPLLPYIAAQPIVVEDERQARGYQQEGQDFEKGGGSAYNQQHHSAHGDKKSKGYSSKGHVVKGASRHHGKNHKNSFDRENEGDKSSHHDEAGAHGKHHAAGKHYRGGDHGHKKHHSKGEEVTGYHKVFNKNEFKKDHDFYDVADSSGHHNKHGYEKKSHGTDEGSHKNAGSKASGQDFHEYGNAANFIKGQYTEAEDEDSKEETNETHNNNEQDYGKQDESNHERKYSNADDDDDADDELYDDDEE